MKPANGSKRQETPVNQSWRIYINAHRHIWMYRGRHRNLAPHELQPRWHRCRSLTADPCQQLHVCVSSQVHTKLQMVDAEALRSLTPPTPKPLIVLWNYTRGVFSAFLTTKLLWRKPRSTWECSGEANQAASERQQSKRDLEQLPLMWEGENRRNQSGVRHWEEEGEKEWREVDTRSS